ncbi:MAG: ABC transporter ATP-binding protein [Oscillospiraceae bacterium]|jgi:oligopeptide/dipeptide ABC transporter ATP-binding protein|nr:ABC transporter ATP-binding protein [Oscillospiraceae bacterium]
MYNHIGADGGKRLLDVRGLKTYFYTDSGVVKAVDDVSFHVGEGETLGVVGESGCGKSVSCMSVVRLVETPPGRYAGGEIIFGDEDMLKIPDARMRQIRGNDISLIFQEPMTSLNPVFRIGSQIDEALMLHQGMNRAQAREASIGMLAKVRIPNPRRIADEYPFALSGGMRQRVMIAMALACNPKLLIADEPTTALDVTIQAQVLTLMNDLKRDIGASIIIITHDLGVIAEMSERVMVMYAGRVAEVADVGTIFKNPLHPYTIGLINSKPDMTTTASRLTVIPGSVPDLSDKPSGCPFHPRCDRAMPECAADYPPEVEVEPRHNIACWLYGGTRHG